MKKLFVVMAALCLAIGAQGQTKPNATPEPKPVCLAVSKSTGQPCKAAGIYNGYCMSHNPNAERCNHIKSDSTACRMRVKEQGIKCHHHINK